MTRCSSHETTATLRAVAAGALLLVSTWANAAVVVGNAAVDRALNDGFSNFVITLPSSSFSAGGSFDQWNVFLNRAGSLGLLILNGSNAAPTVVHSILQPGLVAGFNSFNLAAPLSVSAGDYLGIWMGDTSKVDYDLVQGSTTPYSPNAFYATIPSVGTSLNTGSPNGVTSRHYSINVRFTENAATVSAPGTLALVGLSLLGLAALRRR